MRYLSRRLIHAMFLLAAISILSFALFQLTPGDFFSSLRMNPRISAQTIERHPIAIWFGPIPTRALRALDAVGSPWPDGIFACL